MPNLIYILSVVTIVLLWVFNKRYYSPCNITNTQENTHVATKEETSVSMGTQRFFFHATDTKHMSKQADTHINMHTAVLSITPLDHINSFNPCVLICLNHHLPCLCAFKS